MLCVSSFMLKGELDDFQNQKSENWENLQKSASVQFSENEDKEGSASTDANFWEEAANYTESVCRLKSSRLKGGR